MSNRVRIPVQTKWSVGMVTAMLSLAFSGSAMSASVVNVEVNEMADKTEFTVEFDSPLTHNPRLFRMSNPDRQVVDFSEEVDAKAFVAKFAADSRLKSAQLMSAQGRGRLVFEMANAYQVIQDDSQPNRLRLVFSGPKPFKPTSTLASNLAADSMLKSVVDRTGTPTVSPPVPVLTAWELSATDQEDVIRMTFDRPDVRVDSFMRKDQLRLRIPLGRVAQGVPNMLADSSSGAIKGIALVPGDQVLTLNAQLNGTQHSVRQNGSLVEVAFQKQRIDPMPQPDSAVAVSLPVKAPVGKGRGSGGIVSSPAVTKAGGEVVSNEGRYLGRPISLDFNNADIRTVLQVFSDFTKMNLVVSDSVQGKVTVHLKDVPWDQALDIVMRSKGLVSSRSGNVLLVSSAADATSDQFDAASRRAKDDMEPLVAKTFVVSYQKTAEVLNLLKSKDSKLLSSRGSILSDERTSQIFVEDTPSRLERIGGLIKSMDKPIKQVMIEARIVLADSSVSKELGVKLRGSSNGGSDFDTVGDAVGNKGFINTEGASATSLAYPLFNAQSTRLLSLQLKALETLSKVRTVSNPRVITSNKESAVIEQGTEIPYRVASSSGATSIEFKQASLKLDVTPQISPDGTVLLDVNVSKDSVGEKVSDEVGPAINTRRVKTKVLVNDGGTVVLGGIFEEEDNDSSTKTPFLGDIPLFGHLFKGKTDSKRKAELLIFITPVVLQDS